MVTTGLGEVDAVRADGGLARIRPVCPDDAAAIRALHARSSDRSIYLGGLAAIVGGEIVATAAYERTDPDSAAEQSKVVAGVDAGEDSQQVLEFAFDVASRHGTSLDAVLCWHPSLFRLQRWTGRNVEAALGEAAMWLSTSMAGWRQKYPDVAVTSVVLDAHPVGGLVEASLGEYLLVVAKLGRGARAGTLLGSVSQGVLHHATCPVAVVPVSGVGDGH